MWKAVPPINIKQLNSCQGNQWLVLVRTETGTCAPQTRQSLELTNNCRYNLVFPQVCTYNLILGAVDDNRESWLLLYSE